MLIAVSSVLVCLGLWTAGPVWAQTPQGVSVGAVEAVADAAGTSAPAGQLQDQEPPATDSQPKAGDPPRAEDEPRSEGEPKPPPKEEPMPEEEPGPKEGPGPKEEPGPDGKPRPKDVPKPRPEGKPQPKPNQPKSGGDDGHDDESGREQEPEPSPHPPEPDSAPTAEARQPAAELGDAHRRPHRERAARGRRQAKSGQVREGPSPGAQRPVAARGDLASTIAGGSKPSSPGATGDGEAAVTRVDGDRFVSSDPPSRARRPGQLAPHATVRIAGRMTRRGARVGLLSARAPGDAHVTVRCRGRDCPVRSQSRLGSASARRTASRTMRFQTLQRHLRAGTLIEVAITRDDAVGKFTRFVIRAGKPPLRRDLCIRPGATRPSRCA